MNKGWREMTHQAAVEKVMYCGWQWSERHGKETNESARILINDETLCGLNRSAGDCGFLVFSSLIGPLQVLGGQQNGARTG